MVKIPHIQMPNPPTLLLKAMQSSGANWSEFSWVIPQLLSSSPNSCLQMLEEDTDSVSPAALQPPQREEDLVAVTQPCHPLTLEESFWVNYKFSHTKKKKKKIVPDLELTSHSIVLFGVFCMWRCTPVCSFIFFNFFSILFLFSKNRALKVSHLL